MDSSILLVEPNKLFAQKLKKALVLSGFKVKVTSGSEAAIDSADQQQPDLVLLELELDEHNGIEFLYEFRSYADWLNIPVIICSEVPRSRLRPMSKQLELLGVSQYFEKSKASLAEITASVASELDYASASN